jgi:hypothetical protein
VAEKSVNHCFKNSLYYHYQGTDDKYRNGFQNIDLLIIHPPNVAAGQKVLLNLVAIKALN